MTANSSTHDSDKYGNNKQRVNISISEHIHLAACHEAEKIGENFSQFLAKALVQRLSPESQASSSLEIGSIVTKINDLLEEQEIQGERQQEIHDAVTNLTDLLAPDSEILANKIRAELEKADSALSRPELIEGLPMKPAEIDAGLRQLEHTFIAERIDPKETDNDVPRWRLK